MNTNIININSIFDNIRINDDDNSVIKEIYQSFLDDLPVYSDSFIDNLYKDLLEDPEEYFDPIDKEWTSDTEQYLRFKNRNIIYKEIKSNSQFTEKLIKMCAYAVSNNNDIFRADISRNDKESHFPMYLLFILDNILNTQPDIYSVLHSKIQVNDTHRMLYCFKDIYGNTYFQKLCYFISLIFRQAPNNLKTELFSSLTMNSCFKVNINALNPELFI